MRELYEFHHFKPDIVELDKRDREVTKMSGKY